MPRMKTLSNQDAPLSLPSDKPFPYADYVAAQQTLAQALGGDCFYATLTGNSGMGKTALLGDLSKGLDRHRYNLVYLTSAKVNLVSIVRLIANRLRVGTRRTHLETLNLIAETIHAQKAHMLLWLDEADQLDTNTLQEVRTLAEHKLDAQQLVTVILSGLPELAMKLEAPQLFPLRRRISCRCVLAGLRREELESFMNHRFGKPQAQRVPTAVLDDLFERTQATPALLDQVLRHALRSNKDNLDIDEVSAVLDNHGL